MAFTSHHMLFINITRDITYTYTRILMLSYIRQQHCRQLNNVITTLTFISLHATGWLLVIIISHFSWYYAHLLLLVSSFAYKAYAISPRHISNTIAIAIYYMLIFHY